MNAFSTLFSFLVFHTFSAHSRVLETAFIVRHGNEPDGLGKWEMVRNWFKEENGTQRVKDYCQDAHRKYGLGADKTIETIAFDQRTIKFRTPKYQPMVADVLTYSIDEEGEDSKKHRTYWHITEGERPDACWYLDPLNEERTELELREHVYYIAY